LWIVGTNAWVSGMCILHADTLTQFVKRERPQDANIINHSHSQHNYCL